MHRRTASKRIVTDGRVLGELDQIRHTLKLAQQTEKYNPRVGEGSVAALERRLSELAEAAADGSLEVVVQAIPGEEFDDIARQHPPTLTQLDRWREQAKVFPLAEMPEWDDRGMAPDLLKACLVEPEWSDEWWRGLSKGTQNQLWNLALSVQVAGADLPFFNAATGTTSGGGDLLTTPSNGAFHPPMS
ncbi:MAG TPA: hypothetical protein VJQ79_01890 [Acidimicrobiia bacterium]|nr:hypothetical protein [Acidimicrobiia bacterium]